MPSDGRWIDLTMTTRDGLSLHGRHYRASAGRRPILCLPGLTQNGRDFHDLAMTLSDPRGHRRDVYTLDSRGRGLSESDPNWRNYTIPVELDDALDFMTRLDVSDAAVLGTSRGGILAMAMAAIRPAAIGAVILNDIGPEIDRNGLSRILAYVGRVPLPRSWTEAARIVGEMSREHFPNLTAADCDALARQWFNEASGQPAPGYDANIGRALNLPDGPLPTMWAQFRALSRVPALVMRGGNSDILTAATLAEMYRRHPKIVAHTVPGEGHAPLLRDGITQRLIHDFLLETDAMAV